jgi:predicted O-methyltransferase YrrM
MELRVKVEEAISAFKRPARRTFNRVAARRGYVKVDHAGAGMDHEFAPVLAACQRFSMTSPERMYALYKAVEYVVRARIPGDIVECGVWRGGSAMVAALGLQQFGDTSKSVYLYDTFTGMTEPTNEDGSLAIDKWRKLERERHNEWCFAPLAEVERNLAATGLPPGRIKFVEGRVEDTLPDQAPPEISLLRLDTDWYDSTYHELTSLYPRLSTGGVLILDDYGHWSGHRRAVDEFFGDDPILLNRIDSGGCIGVKW